jgi:large subunit ribosomal protein L6
MSRLGKKPIKIPEDVAVKIQDNILTFKGPKGEIKYNLPTAIKIKVSEDELNLVSSIKKRQERVIYGLTRAAIANIVRGISRGFKKRLVLFGVGYSVKLEGEDLILALGYSHPVKLKKPEGIEIKIAKNDIEISGINREKVGQFAACIRDLKRPEPYKGKGFKYFNEVIRRKVGKTALKTEGEAAAK